MKQKTHDKLAKESSEFEYDAPRVDALPPSMGKGPSGTMKCKYDRETECPGLSKGVIVIEYTIPPSIQRKYHPNPGVEYEGTTRMTFLPNTSKGRCLLTRFKVAFMRGFMFNIGTSQTTGRSNVVIWSSIPNKTSLNGGPFGFPDKNYISVANSELDKLGIPSADKCLDQLEDIQAGRSPVVAELVPVSQTSGYPQARPATTTNTYVSPSSIPVPSVPVPVTQTTSGYSSPPVQVSQPGRNSQQVRPANTHDQVPQKNPQQGQNTDNTDLLKCLGKCLCCLCLCCLCGQCMDCGFEGEGEGGDGDGGGDGGGGDGGDGGGDDGGWGGLGGMIVYHEIHTLHWFLASSSDVRRIRRRGLSYRLYDPAGQGHVLGEWIAPRTRPHYVPQIRMYFDNFGQQLCGSSGSIPAPLR